MAQAKKQDEGHILTDKELFELEQRIREVYDDAAKELQQTIDEHFAKLEKKDKQMQKLLDDGKITQEQYLQWRLSYIGRGKRFEELRDKLAERVTRANEVAISYVNDKTPAIYSLNRNYAAYSVERATGKYGSFVLIDEATVRRLIVEQPDLMPYYPAEKAVQRGLDLEYGRKQITAAVTSGILQGKGTRKIAADLRERIVNMSVESALRTARTAVTAAEGGGRQDTFDRAADMGIKVKRQWVATLDARTRPAHGHADGQIKEAGNPFTVGGEKLMFPGDKSLGASGWNLYNCRCTTAVWDEYSEKDPGKRRARNPITGEWEVIDYTTYDKWMESHKQQNPEAVALALKKAKNAGADEKQWKEYRSIAKSAVPKSFADFQDLKYNNRREWNHTKKFVQYKRRVPEATKDDFQKYERVKETGIKGTIRIPPEKIEASNLEFRDDHATRHGCNVEDAREYIKNAVCSIRNERWDGESINFFSREGATYIDAETLEIKTSYPREDFKSINKAVLEVFE